MSNSLPPVSDPQRQQFQEAVQLGLQSNIPDAKALRVPLGQIDQTAVAYSVFAKLLAADGLRPALYSLLRRTDFRFISIFRFKDGKATSAVHVDRENLLELQAAEVADTATYCCYVRDARGAFVTVDALTDVRTQAHPAREVVRAYCGIPILTPEGDLVGTLCHYDLVPRDPEQLDLELLLQVANTLSQPGIVPPYPSAYCWPEVGYFSYCRRCPFTVRAMKALEPEWPHSPIQNSQEWAKRSCASLLAVDPAPDPAVARDLANYMAQASNFRSMWPEAAVDSLVKPIVPHTAW